MNETTKTVAGIALGTVGLCVIGSFFFFSEKVELERSLVDASTHCPIDDWKAVWGIYEIKPPKVSRRTAVLIDATDRIPPEQRESISGWFAMDFTKTLFRFERVAVYEVLPQENSGDPVLKEPHFAKCAPPVEANKWIENPRFVRKTFEQGFMKKKLEVIRSLASQNEKRWSPIMEALNILFQNNDRIILVSDLMQNTPSCSLYKAQERERDFAGCMSTTGIRLDGKSLNVVFIRRDKIVSLQGHSLLNYWRDFIESREGNFLVEYEPPIIY